ncbi:translocation/assembly module TamB domain-containing protein [Bdellovibrio sp. HCB117]|uniref:translocation/assembly module TamB domain-containing protein n=1 Tax=Bdellovibrio sp. HCB117 TaxID=3394359 RepID=UPI0039B39D21
MKKFFLFLLGFVVLLLLALGVLWMNLDWLLNESNLRKVVQKTQIELGWQNLDLKITNDGFTAKYLKLNTGNLCFKYANPSIDICAKKIHLDTSIGFMTKMPFVQIKNLKMDIISDHILVTVPESTEPKPAEAFQWPAFEFGPLDSFLSRYLALLPKDAIESIHIDIQGAKIFLMPDTEMEASTKVRSEGKDVRLNTDFEMKMKKESFVKAQMNASMTLISPAELQAQGVIELPSFGVKTNLKAQWLEKLQVELDGLMKYQKMQLQSGLKAELQKDLWKLSLLADLKDSRLPFQRLSIQDCDISITVKKGLPGQLTWPCAIEAHKIRKVPLKGLPDSLVLNSLVQSPIDIKKDTLQLQPKAELRMQEPALVELSVDAAAKTTLNLTEKKLKQLEVDQLQALLKIPALENWQSLLVKSAYSLPAPLHVLKGSLELRAEGPPTDLLTKIFNVKASLKTDLTSPRQALKTLSNVELNADIQKTIFTLQGDIGLTEVTLELPYLGFEAPPQFKPDSRFVKKTEQAPPAPKGPSTFIIKELAIHTDATPLRLKTRLLDEAIPIHIKYKLKDTKSLSGTVSIGKMNVEVFKKKAAVERFILKKYPDSTVQDLDGLLIHRTSEVKIEILIVGTTEKPRIELLSDPPLSRQQIISILLFNKSLQQLADEDKNTAGQLDQALLSEAFGLASLFLLSSTPIESVYFDPRTQSYTARVRLDDQTSVSLGSNFETSQQFTVRRRLGGPWSVSTELKQSDNAEDVITTLIEWFKRF